MTRVKRGTIAHKRRERLLKRTRGFLWRRKSSVKAAKEATIHSMRQMLRGRKEKKRTMRGLWQIRINAGTRLHDLSYSKFSAGLKRANITIDRKILSDLVEKDPEVFQKIVEAAKS